MAHQGYIDQEIRDSLRIIQSQRSRNKTLAVVALVLAIAAIGASVYLSYANSGSTSMPPPATPDQHGY